MPRGNRRCRPAPGSALIIAVSLLCGCRGLPSQGPGPDGSSRPAPAPLDPAPRVESRTSAVAPIADPPREIANEEALAPTPMLDAALRRAEAMNHETADEIARPETPVVPPAAPDEGIAEPDPPPQASASSPVAGATPLDAEPPALESWRAAVNRLRTLAGERAEGADPADTWAVREKVLGGLAAADEDGQGAGVRKAVLSALEPLPIAPQPPTAAPETLVINDLHACRRVLGFGNIEPTEGPDCRAGRPFLLYCEVAGLRYEPDGDHFRSRLASTLDAIPEDGGEPVWSQSLGVADDPCARRRRDYFVSYQLTLPKSLAPGNYRLRLTLKDLAAGGTATESIPIVVRP